MKNIHEWQQKKSSQSKISMVTCYDASFAKIIAATQVDAVLVGDTAAEVMHGYKSTVHADLDMMAAHCKAVATQLEHKFVIGDLPFLSYRQDLKTTMQAVHRIMRTGVNAIKLEGAKGNIELIKHITESGVPVMGHIGLTPQSFHQLGGYKVQGRQEAQAQQLTQDALALEDAGCFAIVFECIPATLAQSITKQLTIPSIGIGAGPDVDGQVLVLHDLLGLSHGFTPKFLKRFANGYEQFVQALDQYHSEVTQGDFPNYDQSY